MAIDWKSWATATDEEIEFYAAHMRELGWTVVLPPKEDWDRYRQLARSMRADLDCAVSEVIGPLGPSPKFRDMVDQEFSTKPNVEISHGVDEFGMEIFDIRATKPIIRP